MPAASPELQPDPLPAPATRPASFGAALGLGLAILGAIFIVVRPGSQFTPYVGEAAFAGIVTVLFALFVAVKGFIAQQAITIPRALLIALCAWLALFGFGLAHSPNLGTGIPQTADAAAYVLLLLCGYFIARVEGALVRC